MRKDKRLRRMAWIVLVLSCFCIILGYIRKEPEKAAVPATTPAKTLFPTHKKSAPDGVKIHPTRFFHLFYTGAAKSATVLPLKCHHLVKNKCRLERLRYIDGKSDWIDLRSAAEVVMAAGEFTMIPLGVALQLPEGYEAHIVPRSSTFKNFGIIQTNHTGVVDNSYCGPVYSMVILNEFYPAFST